LITISLTDFDYDLWSLAAFIGKMRITQKKRLWGDPVLNDESLKEDIGVVGELAVGKCFKKKLSFVFRQGDPYDLEICNHSADVKTSQLKPNYDNPKDDSDLDHLNLLALCENKPKELYVQVFIAADRTEAYIRGWCERSYLEEHSKIWVYGGKKLFRLPVPLLNKIDVLVSLDKRTRYTPSENISLADFLGD